MKTMILAVSATLLTIATPAMVYADEGEKRDHPAFMGAMKDFHAVLKVDWHAEKGEARNAAACKNVGNYVTFARAIVAEPGPDHSDAKAWDGASAGLLDASVALGAYCASGNAANVEAGLSTLHDRFHDLMKLMQKPK